MVPNAQTEMFAESEESKLRVSRYLFLTKMQRGPSDPDIELVDKNNSMRSYLKTLWIQEK